MLRTAQSSFARSRQLLAPPLLRDRGYGYPRLAPRLLHTHPPRRAGRPPSAPVPRRMLKLKLRLGFGRRPRRATKRVAGGSPHGAPRGADSDQSDSAQRTRSAGGCASLSAPE